MTPEALLSTGIVPALEYLRGHGIQDTPAARRLLMSIAMQESGLRHRRQVTAGGTENGPAVSFWQFEQGGGCKGMLTHHASGPIMKAACTDFNIEPTIQGLWEGMRYNDVIAAIASRLMIFVLPSAMALDANTGWKQYVAAWRPGKPHPEKWSAIWSAADLVVKARP